MEILVAEILETLGRQTYCGRGDGWDRDAYRDCTARLAGAGVHRHSHWPFHTCDRIRVGQALAEKGSPGGHSGEEENRMTYSHPAGAI